MPDTSPFEIVTAIALVFSGLFGVIRQYLLEPGTGQYPKAPSWLRTCMLGSASVQIFVGLQLIMGRDEPTGPMGLLALGLFFYSSAMLVNVLRQRYPEDVWHKLNKINDRLFCSKSEIRRWLVK